MRKALIVGVDYYEHFNSLYGCVNDAGIVKRALERHATADQETNFTAPRLMTASSEDQAISRGDIKDAVKELFADDAEVALFYFAGHGSVDPTGGFLCASDCERGDDGVSLAEVMRFANTSPAANKVILLDSCHSGIAGAGPLQDSVAELKEGVTILTASTANQYAVEKNGRGLFTGLLVDALDGGAANLVGDITPGSVYAHIDQSLGPWAQRPVFKTNVKRFVSLRKVKPTVPKAELLDIVKYFPTADYRFPLDPSYEPERWKEQLDDSSIPPPDPDHVKVFGVLQRYAKVNVAQPVDAEHMWHAAMKRTWCELTVLGRHYWQLVTDGLI